MSTLTMTDLKHAFSFPFKDKDWQQKFLIGSLVAFAGFIVPIIPWFFLYGYGARVMRRIIVDKQPPTLPEWDNWEELFRDGIKLLGVTLIYFAPMILLFIIGWAVMMLPSFALPFLEDIVGVGAMIWLSLGGTLVGMFIFWIGTIVLMTMGAIMPAGIGHVIAKDEFTAAFWLKDWWRIFRANWGGFAISYLLLIGAWMLATYALYFLMFLCCLLPLFMAPLTFYSMNLMSALFGQAYREGTENLVKQKTAIENEIEISN